jgi:hypothetical protein
MTTRLFSLTLRAASRGAMTTGRPQTRPASGDRRQDPGISASMQVLLALAAGTLLSAGYALHPIWWAPWFAPVLLLLAASGTPLPSRAIGCIVGVMATTSLLSYYITQVATKNGRPEKGRP